MAACSFQEIFEKPLPENPTLIESLSSPWKQIKSNKPAELSFTEIFGELHFRENSESSPPSPLPLPPRSSSSSSVDINLQPEIQKVNEIINENKRSLSLDSMMGTQKSQYVRCSKNGNGYSSKKAESLQLCTEGLGFESSDDVEEYSKTESCKDDWGNHQKEKVRITKSSSSLLSSDNVNEFRRSKTIDKDFPPPINCIGKSGKPWVCLQSFRYNGRFVLKEIQIPTKEFLHACREDGRLTLHLVQQDQETPEEEGEGEEELETEQEQEEKEEETDEQEKESKSELSNKEAENNL